LALPKADEALALLMRRALALAPLLRGLLFVAPAAEIRDPPLLLHVLDNFPQGAMISDLELRHVHRRMGQGVPSGRRGDAGREVGCTSARETLPHGRDLPRGDRDRRPRKSEAADGDDLQKVAIGNGTRRLNQRRPLRRPQPGNGDRDGDPLAPLLSQVQDVGNK
jgi:hypothetical protein